MDMTEAKALLASELQKYRTLSYTELRERIGSEDDYVAAAPSGREYGIEIDFFWDDWLKRDIRVMGMIDDGSTRYTRRPLVDSFILAPDGHFVGEDAA